MTLERGRVKICDRGKEELKLYYREGKESENSKFCMIIYGNLYILCYHFRI